MLLDYHLYYVSIAYSRVWGFFHFLICSSITFLRCFYCVSPCWIYYYTVLYPSLPPISTCSSCGSGGCSFSECSYGTVRACDSSVTVPPGTGGAVGSSGHWCHGGCLMRKRVAAWSLGVGESLGLRSSKQSSLGEYHTLIPPSRCR